MKSKKTKTMADVSAGYESFIKEKKIKDDGKKAFNKVIKKASKPKPRSSK